jgi:hypothetical protein
MFAPWSQVEVDRAVADSAPAEVGDERFTEQVQERTAEEDRNAGSTGVGVDLFHVGRHGIRRIEHERARFCSVADLDPVNFEQRTDDPDIADLRHIAQGAGRVAEQRCHHRLGREILRASDGDPSPERTSAAHQQHLAGRFGSCRLRGVVAQKRLHPG